MNDLNTPIQKGLPGLREIREHLGLTQRQVAERVECSADFIRYIESGRSDCRQEVQRQISRALCCKVADLLESPSSDRLSEIEIEFKERELERLKAGEQTGAA